MQSKAGDRILDSLRIRGKLLFHFTYEDLSYVLKSVLCLLYDKLNTSAKPFSLVLYSKLRPEKQVFKEAICKLKEVKSQPS